MESAGASRSDISFLRGSLTISNDSIDTHELRYYTSEADSILDVLHYENDPENVQLCLGNLRDMQANLVHIIPQYQDATIISELIALKETIEATLERHEPLPSETKGIMLRMSMNEIMQDLAPINEEESYSDPLGELEECCVCLEDRQLEQLPCGHSFCRQCIQQHLQVSLTEGKVQDLQCLSSSACDFQFTEPILESFLSKTQFARYQQFLLASAVRADPNKKCCTLPDCNGILTRNQDLEFQKEWKEHPFTVCDDCLTEQCFECARAYHPSLTCKAFEKELRFKRLLTDEEDIKRWQKENNAKPCPRCKTLIIKSEGCNHMKCPTCGENFCWICSAKGATEGHFNIPGKCFGRLFVEDDSSSGDTIGSVVGYVLFLPILAPIFGISSAVEGIHHQGRKMSRRMDGVDYVIIVIGESQEDRESLLQTYATLDENSPNQEMYKTYKKSTLVGLVRCRVTFIHIAPERLELEECMDVIKGADGFVLLYRPENLGGLDEIILMNDELSKIFSRAGVPGSLFSCVQKKRQKKSEIPKKVGDKKAKDLGLLFKQISVSKHWGVSRALKSLLKAMLERWEPLVVSFTED